MTNQLVQQCWLDQIGFVGNKRTLGKDDVFGGGRISWQETPVNVATIAQIGIVGVLRCQWEDLDLEPVIYTTNNVFLYQVVLNSPMKVQL